MRRPRFQRVFVFLFMAPSSLCAAQTLDQVVGRTVRAHYEILHRCFRKALAENRSRAGTVYLRVTMGKGDAVHSVRSEREELGHAATVACLLGAVKRWSIAGAAAAGADSGSEITIPLTFRPSPKQFVIRSTDASQLQVGKTGSARLLLTKGNVGAAKASMVLLSIRGKLSLPVAPADLSQALVILSGKGQLKRKRLEPGTAIWVPPGARAQLSGKMEALQILLPAGKARAYWTRDRAAPATSAKIQAMRKERVRTLAGGALRVTPLLRRGAIYVGLMETEPGQQIRPHAHLTEDELVYVLAGTGTVALEGRGQKIASGHALYLPAGSSHRLEVSSRMKAVQVFVPAGPERRYLGRGLK